MLKSIWRRVIGGHIAAAAFVLPALLVPPAPAGAQGVASAAASAQARIWVYRNFEPSLNLNLATVRLNGVIAGVSQPGGSSYRDVPPGHYHLSVDSYGVDFNQTRDVDLPPGAQVFAKVVSNDNWIEGGGGGRGGGGYHRNTFYVWLYPFEAAWPIIAQSWFYGGGGVATAALPPG